MTEQIGIEEFPLPWVVGPFGHIWVAADVEALDGKWRETRPKPRLAVMLDGLGREAPLAEVIVRSVNSHDALVKEIEGLQAWQRARLEMDDMARVERDSLVKALNAACGYLMNAKIDLETGCTKATAVRTIEGGLKMVREALASAEAGSGVAVTGGKSHD